MSCGQIKGNYDVKKLSYLFFQDTAAVSKVNFVMKNYFSCAFVIYDIHIQISTRNMNPFPTESKRKREFIITVVCIFVLT